MDLFLKIIRIIGIILIIIGCIISIPLFIGGAIVLAFMWPGFKLWQIADEKLENLDKDLEVTVSYVAKPCGCKTPKCAK